MEITYATPISDLIDVGAVESRTGLIESIINEYQDRGDAVLRGELSSNLSEQTFNINNDSIIFNRVTSICQSMSSIDISSLSNIVSKAQEKREEELLRLKTEVIKRIVEIEGTIRSNELEISGLLFLGVIIPNSEQKIASLRQINKSLAKEKEDLEEKLVAIESELGGV